MLVKPELTSLSARPQRQAPNDDNAGRYTGPRRGGGGPGNSGTQTTGVGAGDTGGTGGFGVPGQAGISRDSHSSIFPIGKGGDAAMGCGHGGANRCTDGRQCR